MKKYILASIIIGISIAFIGTGVYSATVCQVFQGCTGASTLTDGGILLGSGTGAITALGVASNGQIPIGDNSTDPVLAVIVGDDGITITNSAGGIEIDVTPLASGADADSSTSQSDSGLEIVSNGLVLLRGCTDNQILKWDETQDDWNCEADAEGAAAASTTLDVIEDLKASSTIEFASSTWTIDTAAASSTFFIDGDSGIVQTAGNFVPITDSASELGSSSIFWSTLFTDAVRFSDGAGDTLFKAINVGGGVQYQFHDEDASPVQLNLNITGSNATWFYSGAGGIKFSTDIEPESDASNDLGGATVFWDETFSDELILSNVGIVSTGSNTVRLSGLDLAAGDTGLIINTEDETEYLFASDVMFGTTATSTAPIWWDLSASSTEIANLGRISFNDEDVTFTHTANTLTIAGGNFVMERGTIAVDDTTPDVSGGNIFTTSENVVATAITDLDNPTVGQFVTIIGGSNGTSTTIADSGNFNLSAAFTANLDDVITLFVQADNDYIEISRSNN